MTAALPRARSPVAELVGLTLERIPTAFGRLIFVSSTHDTAAGRYELPKLSRMFGAEPVDLELRHCHHRIFLEWLTQGIEEQKGDLEAFLRDLPATGHPFQELERVARALAPPGARDVERQLYLADLETLIELLKFDRL